jgi:hypothetical protein
LFPPHYNPNSTVFILPLRVNTIRMVPETA